MDQTLLNWLKALHLIGVMAWMAAMLYLPRLFAYHADAAPGSDIDAKFQIMERRLLRAIMNPAMIASYVFGGVLLYYLWTAYKSQGWLHAKLTLIVVLTVAASLVRAVAQALRARRKPAAGALLQNRQRGRDAVHDRHRHSRDRETVLKIEPWRKTKPKSHCVPR